MRALVVDDSRSMRMIIGRILKELGFEVAEAGHGQEALERLQQIAQVDLALVDWNMPVMSGYEFVRAVRSNLVFNEMRIMMVTTESSMSYVMQALEAGANEYVMKPFTKEIMREKLALLGMGSQHFSQSGGAAIQSQPAEPSDSLN